MEVLPPFTRPVVSVRAKVRVRDGLGLGLGLGSAASPATKTFGITCHGSGSAGLFIAAAQLKRTSMFVPEDAIPGTCRAWSNSGCTKAWSTQPRAASVIAGRPGTRSTTGGLPGYWGSGAQPEVYR
eukprot:scaffold1665_cov67-Phaeocystis_antarctica.AAC.2